MVRHPAAAAGLALRWRALFAALLSTAALVQSVNSGEYISELVIFGIRPDHSNRRDNGS